MSICINVDNYDEFKKTVLITVLKDGVQLLKSLMKCKSQNKTAIEKQIKKDLRVYDTHHDGGMIVNFLCEIKGE